MNDATTFDDGDTVKPLREYLEDDVDIHLSHMGVGTD